jgi:hypothetical protein
VIVHFVDIGGIVEHQFKLSLGERPLFILLIHLSPEERLNCDGQQFYQYQQNEQSPHLKKV